MQRKFLSSIQLLALLLLTFSFSSHAGIRLSVHLRDDLDSSQVKASGFEVFPLTDNVAKVFGIPRQVVGKSYHDGIWGLARKKWGRPPDEFVTSDPVRSSQVKGGGSSWNVYSEWDIEEHQVMVERRAVRATVISSTGNVDSIVTGSVRNASKSMQPGQEIELNYNEEVEDSRFTERSWAMSLTNGIEVSVGGEYAGFSAGSTRSIEFTVEQGGSKGKSRTVTKGRGVRLKANVDAEPETVYPVSVVAGKGSLRVKIDYEYRLRGSWMVFYVQKSYHGRLAPPLADITELLEHLNKPLIIRDSEVIDVGFVTDGEISIGESYSIHGKAPKSSLLNTETETSNADNPLALAIDLAEEMVYDTKHNKHNLARWERVLNTLQEKPGAKITLTEAVGLLHNGLKNNWNHVVERWFIIVDGLRVLQE